MQRSLSEGGGGFYRDEKLRSIERGWEIKGYRNHRAPDEGLVGTTGGAFRDPHLSLNCAGRGCFDAL